MSDWLLLKCPSCGNLFRVPMNSGKDSAECSMCHQLVHFDPSDTDEDAEETEEDLSPPQPAVADEHILEIDDEAIDDEALLDLDESDESKIEDETPTKLENASLGEEEKPDVEKRTVKASTVPVTSASEAEHVSDALSQGGEEKFHKTDVKPQVTSSTRGDSSRSSKRRRVKNAVSRRDEFGWESDQRRRRRSDRTTVLFVVGSVAVMAVLMMFLLSRGQGGRAESESEKKDRQQQELMLSQQASALKDAPVEAKAVVDTRPRWQVEFNNSPDRFMRKLRPIMEGFLNAKNWEDRLRFCADTETVRPLMEDYYKENEDGPIDYQEVFNGGSVSIGEFFITANLLLGDYSNRGFVMLRDEDGSWSVDWESFVGYSSMSMAKFKKERPTEPQLFRLSISRPYPSYFNYQFSDEQQWDCYLLTGRDLDQILYAYVKKFSESASDLNAVFSLKGEAAITVMIRFPEDAQSANQVEIAEVIGEGWVPTIMRKADAE